MPLEECHAYVIVCSISRQSLENLLANMGLIDNKLNVVGGMRSSVLSQITLVCACSISRQCALSKYSLSMVTRVFAQDFI